MPNSLAAPIGPQTIIVATMGIRLQGGSAQAGDTIGPAPTGPQTIIVATMGIKHLQGSAHGTTKVAWTTIVAFQNMKHPQGSVHLPEICAGSSSAKHCDPRTGFSETCFSFVALKTFNIFNS